MAAGGLREALLRLPPFGEHALQAPVAARRSCAASACRSPDIVQPALEPFELRRGQTGLQALELTPELLGPFGRARLQRERAQTLAHLVLEVAGALDLHIDPRQLELSAVPPPLEAAEPGRLLDERAPLGRLGGEDLLDAALADDRMHLAAEADVGQELHDVRAAHVRAVHEVLALAATVQAPHDRELGELDRPVAVLVVEEELDLAVVRRRPPFRPGVEDVLGLLRPQLRRAEASRRPEDPVRDVRLPRPVRPHDHGDARLEAHLDRVRERLETPQLDRAQVHARRSLTRRTDGLCVGAKLQAAEPARFQPDTPVRADDAQEH